MKWLLVLGFICTAIIRVPGQTDSGYVLVTTLPLEAKLIETDRLGNLYAVSTTNQLYKYNTQGKLLATLNYTYSGSIAQVDASNPMEIYVFYKELNKVIILDNNLAFRGEMPLSGMQIIQASAIARSFDNGIWIFDLGDLQLKRMDKSGENGQFSGNVRQFVNTRIQPFSLYDNGTQVFVCDSTVGILIFDVFATYLRTLPEKGISRMKVIDDEVYYLKNQLLYRYPLKSRIGSSFQLPGSGMVKDVSIEKSYLYVMRSNRIQIYRY